ncbi:MAG: hypothetical protein ACRC92_27300 [Peptostreptococcaceae bacterium]
MIFNTKTNTKIYAITNLKHYDSKRKIFNTFISVEPDAKIKLKEFVDNFKLLNIEIPNTSDKYRGTLFEGMDYSIIGQRFNVKAVKSCRCTIIRLFKKKNEIYHNSIDELSEADVVAKIELIPVDGNVQVAISSSDFTIQNSKKLLDNLLIGVSNIN